MCLAERLFLVTVKTYQVLNCIVVEIHVSLTFILGNNNVCYNFRVLLLWMSMIKILPRLKSKLWISLSNITSILLQRMILVHYYKTYFQIERLLHRMFVEGLRPLQSWMKHWHHHVKSILINIAKLTPLAFGQMGQVTLQYKKRIL